MRVPLGWLGEFVDIGGIPPDELVSGLESAGFEVPCLEVVGEETREFKVAKVLKVERPQGLRLSLVEIWTGSEKIQVLCGAPNIREGAKYPFSPPDSIVRGQKISIKEARGVKSYGMLLSPYEVGFSAPHDELLELPDEIPEGTKVSEALGLPEITIDVDVTPQRGDLLGIVGMAREVSAIFSREFKFPEYEKKKSREILAEVKVDNPNDCPIYTLRHVKVKGGKTPSWMLSRLYLMGARPINLIVDVTNYVLFELGQPLHAFDKDKVKGGIFVRRAKDGERILCLDGKERELEADVLVIADLSGPIAIAGVIGGEETGVTESTCEVLLESAFFRPGLIRMTSKKLGVETESSYRFSRRVDPEGVLTASRRAFEFYEKLANGIDVGLFIFDSGKVSNPVEIRLPEKFPEEYIGAKYTPYEIDGILKRLSCKVRKEGGEFIVTPPSFRGDLEIKEDLVEEVARFSGYHRIKHELPYLPSSQPKTDFIEELLEKVRDFLVSCGFFEVTTFSFVPPKLLKFFRKEPVRILNPITDELTHLRTSLIPGLIGVLSRNTRYGIYDVRIFEVGKVFDKRGERLLVGGLATGSRWGELWAFPKENLDFFDLKFWVEGIIKCSGKITKLAEGGPEIFEQRFSITFEGREIGYAGIIRKDILEDEGVETRESTFAFEIDVEAIAEPSIPRFREFQKHPTVVRDISFVIDERVPWEEVRSAIEGEFIEDIRLFDIWKGKEIPEGKRSMTVRLYIKGPKTFTSEEISNIFNRVKISLKSLGATIRGGGEDES